MGKLEKLKNYLKTKLKTFLFLFLFFNVLLFILITFTQTIGRPHPLAKINMSTAVFVDYIYIIPLSKLFGPYNILTKPLYSIRDNFYKRGYKLLPDNDAEKDIWWSRIRFNEWFNCIQPDLLSSLGGDSKIEKNKAEFFLSWSNQMYSRLEPIARLKIKDPEFKRVRLKTFNKVAWSYVRSTGSLLHKLFYPVNNLDFPYNSPMFTDKKYTFKKEKILNMYRRLKSSLNEDEKKQLLGGSKYYLDPLLEYELSVRIIGNKIIEEKLNCKDLVVKIYLNSHKILLKKVLNDSRVPKYHKFRIKLSMKTTFDKFVQKKVKNKCL